MKRIAVTWMACLLVFGIFAAGAGSKSSSAAENTFQDILLPPGDIDQPEEGGPADQTPRFMKKKVILMPGDTFSNKLYDNSDPVVWESSDTSVVSVSSSGKARGKKRGKAVVTAAAGGQKYRYTIVVKKKTVKNRIRQIINNAVTEDMSRYEKIKAVHNWMIENVKSDAKLFSWGYVPLISHTAKGAFVKGVAVCDGYAYAFQMVMKKLKIPCRFVVGSSDGVGHAWNMVKLGGKWYHVDVTFDDPIVNNSFNNKTPFYWYFLKSSSVMKKDHTWKVKNYPQCNSKKYNKKPRRAD